MIEYNMIELVFENFKTVNINQIIEVIILCIIGIMPQQNSSKYEKIYYKLLEEGN